MQFSKKADKESQGDAVRRNIGRLGLALDLHDGLGLEQPLPRILLVGIKQAELQTHARANLHRLDETQAVETIIDGHFQTLRHDHDVFHQLGHQ